MRDWAVSLSGISGILQPEQEMTNFFSIELERGRTARPPYTPYVTTDSLATAPWMPPDEPHSKALGRWKASQVTFHRNTGSQDLSLAQFALYRMRYILAGDLTGAWSDYNRIDSSFHSPLANDQYNIQILPGITTANPYPPPTGLMSEEPIPAWRVNRAA